MEGEGRKGKGKQLFSTLDGMPLHDQPRNKIRAITGPKGQSVEWGIFEMGHVGLGAVFHVGIRHTLKHPDGYT